MKSRHLKREQADREDGATWVSRIIATFIGWSYSFKRKIEREKKKTCSSHFTVATWLLYNDVLTSWGCWGACVCVLLNRKSRNTRSILLVHSCTVLVRIFYGCRFFSTSYSYGWNSTVEFYTRTAYNSTYYTNNKMFRSIIRVGQAFGGVGRPAGLDTGHAATRLFGKSSRSISYQR